MRLSAKMSTGIFLSGCWLPYVACSPTQGSRRAPFCGCVCVLYKQQKSVAFQRSDACDTRCGQAAPEERSGRRVAPCVSPSPSECHGACLIRGAISRLSEVARTRTPLPQISLSLPPSSLSSSLPPAQAPAHTRLSGRTQSVRRQGRRATQAAWRWSE